MHFSPRSQIPTLGTRGTSEKVHSRNGLPVRHVQAIRDWSMLDERPELDYR
jgi:hypothetical protein